jgi:hypothetical protein
MSLDLGFNILRNPHFSGELDKIIWFCGSSEITIVNLQDLKMTEYKNFLPSLGPGKDPVALRSIMRNGGETLVVSFMVDNTFGVAYQHKSLKEPNIYLLADVAPRCRRHLLVKSLLAMENGAETSTFVFFAGQSEFDTARGERSQAIISCVNMAYDLTPVATYMFPDPRWFAASSIRRIRPSVNEFLVGMNQAIKVVLFEDRNFREIMSFDTCHSGKRC